MLLRYVPRAARAQQWGRGLLPTSPGLLQQQQQQQQQQRRWLSRRSRGERGSGLVRSRDGFPPPPAQAADADPWQAVTDPATGKIYYWNTSTDETTALGAPRPMAGVAVHEPQRPGLLGMVVEGMAWGTGMSLANRAVSSMFGGGSSGGGTGDAGGDGGDGDEWDV